MDKDYLLANYVIRSEKLQDEIARVIRHKGNNITIDFDLEKLSQRDRDQRIQVIFHEVAHVAEWRYTTMDEWNKQSEREYAFITGQADELPRSKSVTALQKAFTKAGIGVKYDKAQGMLVFQKKELSVLESISEYMEEYNDLGKDAISELVAESIRYVTLHGEGKNEIADIVAGEVLEWY